MTTALAPAKVNLYLHVGAPDAAGYHPLASLVAFADVGDRLTLAPAESFVFDVTGPFGAGLASENNLVVRAVRGLAERAEAPMPELRLTLDKQLPVAAGLGGGSSDAAAALRLVRGHAFPDASDETLRAVLGELGADGPMCLAARPVTAEGYGERLTPAPGLPRLHAVLVNPGVECPTDEIYAAYDRAGRFGGSQRGDLSESFESAEDVAAALAGCRNDLQAPAVAAQPVIGEALAALASEPQCLLARMSGSGATVFGLCRDGAAAQGLAARLGERRSGWWIRACRLGGPWD